MKSTLSLALSVVSLLLVLPPLAYSSEWVYVGINTALDTFHIDLESIEIDDPVVTYKVKSIETKTKKYRVDHLSTHCRDKTVAARGWTNYDADGRVADTRSVMEKDLSWEPIAPDTMMDFFRKMLCDNGQPRKDPKNHLRGWEEFLKKKIDRENKDQ
jgi:hypothetical protein